MDNGEDKKEEEEEANEEEEEEEQKKEEEDKGKGEVEGEVDCNVSQVMCVTFSFFTKR